MMRSYQLGACLYSRCKRLLFSLCAGVMVLHLGTSFLDILDCCCLSALLS